MNWIERLYEIKNKDLYSQSGEGLILEYIYYSIAKSDFCIGDNIMFDIGAGDKFILSNSRHIKKALNTNVYYFEKESGSEINLDNCLEHYAHPNVISIDIDGNDYWILDKMLPHYNPIIVIAEFNAMYTDSRTIKYNPDHVWAGDSYYGFTFEAGKKLAEKHGYKVIFQLADMNMFMVRADLIDGLTFPEVTYKQNDFFKLSAREDWVYL